jgi:hypothetical protein
MNQAPNWSTLPRDFVTLVSGLPRSGTSMVLQMLAAGGMEVLTDGVRAADDDNPRGYLELEKVKCLKQDASWVSGALGKAVKVIYYWLADLPLEYRYRVLFVRRNLDEVLASQSAMLARRGTFDSTDDSRMRRLFENELREIDEWLARHPTFSVLSVDYQAVVDEPLDQARQINTFLGGRLDECAMAAAVDRSLYRNVSRRP